MEGRAMTARTDRLPR